MGAPLAFWISALQVPASMVDVNVACTLVVPVIALNATEGRVAVIASTSNVIFHFHINAPHCCQLFIGEIKRSDTAKIAGRALAVCGFHQRRQKWYFASTYLSARPDEALCIGG